MIAAFYFYPPMIWKDRDLSGCSVQGRSLCALNVGIKTWKNRSDSIPVSRVQFHASPTGISGHFIKNRGKIQTRGFRYLAYFLNLYAAEYTGKILDMAVYVIICLISNEIRLSARVINFGRKRRTYRTGRSVTIILTGITDEYP